MGIESYDTNPANNDSAPDAGAPEGMQAGKMNNVLRQIMADTKTLWGMPPHTTQATETGNRTLVESDRGTWLPVSGTTTITTLAAATAGYGYSVGIINLDASLTVTVDPNSSETFNGSASSISLFPGEWVFMWADATNWHGLRGGSSSLISAIAGLTPTDSNIIIGDGSTWVAESGATARTSLGLAIDTDVQGVNAAVSNYVKGQTIFVGDDTGVNATNFDIDAVIAASWESVGPTGSSATNIWTGMDDIPANSPFVRLRILNTITGSTDNNLYSQIIYARVTGSSAGVDLTTQVSLTAVYNRSGAAESVTDPDLAYPTIPLDSSLRFDLYRIEAGASANAVAEALMECWGQ